MLARAAAAAAGTVLLAAASVAPAHSAGIVYGDKGNVWVATPDGAVNRALTTDGSETRPEYAQAPKEQLVGPYMFPSADDTGRIIAVRYRYGSNGEGNYFWKFMGPDGAQVASNIVSMYQGCSPAPRPLGPFDARISPDGGYVAFSFYCAARYIGLNSTTTWVQDSPEWAGERPSWFGKRLVKSSGGNSFVQADGAQAPLEDNWQGWLAADEGESIGRAEVARTGGKFMYERKVAGVQSLLFGTYTGGMPPSGGATMCKLGTAAAPDDGTGDPASFHATWSPDGSMIAWQDAEGVKVAQAPDLGSPANGEGKTCALPSAPKLLSATGEHPVFTAYTWTAAGAGGSGTTAGGGSTPGGTTPGSTPNTTPAAGTLAGTLPASIKAAALAKGVTLKLTVPAAGKLAAKGTVPAALAKRLGIRGKGKPAVATGSATSRAAGPATVKLRLAAGARRRAARLRGKKLAVEIVFTPVTGTPSSVKGTIRVR